MARPVKQGLDYFPLDTNLDNKLELFEAEFGLEGFAFIIKLYQKIYNNGYFFEWNNDEQLLFAKKINVSIKSINVYINSAIQRGIFDKNIYEKYSVLTSRGIQKRYLEACKRRKQIEIMKEYFLIDISNPDYKEFSSKIVFVNINSINVNINSSNCNHNVNNNPQNVDINSQRKEKKSKVNNNIYNNNINNNITTTINNNICEDNVNINSSEDDEDSVVGVENFSDDCVIDFYNKHIDNISDYSRLFIKQCRNKNIPDDLIIYAMEIAIDNNKKTIAYIKGILNNWEKADITSVLEAKQNREENLKNKTKQKNYNNYQQRQYSNLNTHYANSKDKTKEEENENISN